MRGSSVIESLWAVLIIGSAVLGLALLIGGIIHGNHHIDRLALAVVASNAQSEQLIAAAPLDPSGLLTVGAHPPSDVNGLRYQALDAAANVTASSVAAPAAAELLRRWDVFDATTTRCLRRVRVSVKSADGANEITSSEFYVSCP